MAGGPPELEVRAPSRCDEWERYFDLRWRVLRAPWHQPRGSERDDREGDAIHLALWDPTGRPFAVGRVHLNSSTEAQIRYMAVEAGSEGLGLGRRILDGLEAAARAAGAKRVVLNARAGAQRFYERAGYGVAGPAETMFGQIPHSRMVKHLPLAA